MPAWALALLALAGNLFNAVLEGIGAYELGKANGRLAAQLAQAQGTITNQQRELARVRLGLAERYRLEHLDADRVSRLRQWYAARA